MKPEELAYLAGFIDGEGAFIVNRRLHKANGYTYEGYSVYMDIGNTDEEVMKWIHDIVEVTSNIYRQKQSNNRRDMFRLRIGGKQAIELTKKILPYLRIKKIFAEKFITYPLNHRRKDKDIAIQLFRDFRKMNIMNGKSHPRNSLCVETNVQSPKGMI